MHKFSIVYILYLLKGCPPWHYGLECRSNCVGHCKDNEPCNHINGLCDNGCNDGWTEKNCSEGEMFILMKKVASWRNLFLIT